VTEAADRLHLKVGVPPGLRTLSEVADDSGEDDLRRRAGGLDGAFWRTARGATRGASPHAGNEERGCRCCDQGSDARWVSSIHIPLSPRGVVRGRMACDLGCVHELRPRGASNRTDAPTCSGWLGWGGRARADRRVAARRQNVERCDPKCRCRRHNPRGQQPRFRHIIWA
jgi:hypothetical protein